MIFAGQSIVDSNTIVCEIKTKGEGWNEWRKSYTGCNEALGHCGVKGVTTGETLAFSVGADCGGASSFVATTEGAVKR